MLVILPLVLPLAPPEVELVHRAPEDRVLEVVLRQQQATRTVSETWYPVVDGKVRRDEGAPLDVEREQSFEVEIVLRDAYGERDEDGLPRTLERSFETVDVSFAWTESSEGAAESGEGEWTSPLLDRTVVFERDGDGYAARFAEDDEGDDDGDSGFDGVLLDGMDVDAFGDWYLPPADAGPLEPGATWDAGVDAWHRTLDVGGDFWIGPERDAPPGEAELEERHAIRGGLRRGGDGAVRCTFVGTETVDGTELAVVEIELDVEVAAEHEAPMEVEDPSTDPVEVARSIAVRQEIVGEGRLLWDVDASLPHTLRLDVRTTTTERLVLAHVEGGGGDAWVTVTEDELTVDYAFRAPD